MRSDICLILAATVLWTAPALAEDTPKSMTLAEFHAKHPECEARLVNVASAFIKNVGSANVSEPVRLADNVLQTSTGQYSDEYEFKLLPVEGVGYEMKMLFRKSDSITPACDVTGIKQSDVKEWNLNPTLTLEEFMKRHPDCLKQFEKTMFPFAEAAQDLTKDELEGYSDYFSTVDILNETSSELTYEIGFEWYEIIAYSGVVKAKRQGYGGDFEPSCQVVGLSVSYR